MILMRLVWLDLRTYRLPDIYTLPLMVAGLVLAAGVDGIGLINALTGCLIGFALFWAVGHFYYRRTGQEGLGLGDAKLFSACGAWLGVGWLPYVLLVATVGGLIIALIRKPTTNRQIAFGPWLAIGFWLVWVRVHF
ncbi:A24 family peptidase [Sulfitobacter sp. F26204]|nr:A24 family peptidase [Sulfitobacter sp. F26204]